ncbi:MULTISPECIES: sugar efflux transporter SetB [Buttiauxella]|jgi:SET family sugar efflux transporter-like MFS transporter|uniref:Sugar efflux transporter B n=1 Tax=Buttiauxella ferragutiae ATCC 51602 TaxID=1354252 RepID=A0ABX2W7U3_9ENTR|nr:MULTISPECIES: sugar efflux transporter SetB [Buttiauxella]AYN29605.1 sugar efflux transporter SetB [Buttiauxella sp. 3AFRM03]MCE0828554.1 sugar efflux transporter SetB [Buttiauxella ferragutiae]OAT27278.1 sugar efflux transporter B [Buttiauxella ferragutiae ATCC 51602]TDN55237.1 SET family sugar efflux transporter-like MFS transporter [Buttiauxella sp. JUb87]UNK62736.1 sugar efflux transporter SetB [Buttiauxella ferragutiae]
MQNSPIAATRKPLDITSSAFLIVAFLTGIAGALQTPTLSLFLTEEVHVRPAMVGFFFTGSAVIGILVSQFLAGRSDRKGDRKSLIFVCCLLGALACVLFAWNRNYFVLLFVGVFLSSFGSTANPQMFALAREHADRTGREAVMFSSILRAQVSLAWVIGPPIAYALALGFGFTAMYLSAALAFVVCSVMVRMLLPSMRKELAVKTTTLEAPRRNRRDALLLFVACTMMWGCNSLYIINMPLYIIHELHLPEKLAGVMMGTAAGLEIPTMLIAGYYAKRFGKRFLMRIAGVAGLLFYIGMLTLHNEFMLLALQLLNAIFIGILAGIGMLYFQDLMPGQAGAATTLYTNTTRVGWIIAGSMAGVVAEIWNYHTVFYIALGMIGITAWCMVRIKDI